jgi:hypothetical protein
MASARTTGRNMSEMIAWLDCLELQANHLKVPLSYASMLYMLRSYIGLVRAGVNKHAQRGWVSAYASVAALVG